MPPEIVGADAEIVALGLEATVEERIAEVLMARYRNSDVLTAYLKALDQVESEEILKLAGEGPSPGAYLALNDTAEEPLGGGFSMLTTTWKILLRLPMPAEMVGPLLLTRSRLVGVFKSLTFGSDNPGVIDNEESPGSPWAYRLAKWERVDASDLDPGNATLRTLIGFSFESKIHTVTREVY